jgi:hypothetical protein
MNDTRHQVLANSFTYISNQLLKLLPENVLKSV